MPASTAGSRKRCISAQPSRGRRHVREQTADDLVGVDALGLRVEVQQNPVAQDRRGQRRDVLVGDVIAAARQRARLRRQHDELRGADAGAEVDVFLDEVGRACAVGAWRAPGSTTYSATDSAIGTMRTSRWKSRISSALVTGSTRRRDWRSSGPPPSLRPWRSGSRARC